MPPPGSDPGPFLSFLDWINTAGEVPLNLFRGRPGAAGRKAVDFLGDIPDAILPGDWIGDLSTEEDDVTAHDVLGLDPMQNPAGAKIADIIGGTLANPLSYVGLRGGTVKYGAPFTEGRAIPGASEAIGGAKGLAGQAWQKVPEKLRTDIESANDATLGTVRQSLNLLDVPPEGQELMSRAGAAGNIAGRAGMDRTKQIYQGLTSAERQIVGDTAHGIARGGSKDRATWKAIEDIGGLDEYIAANGGRVDAVKQAVADRQSLMGTYLQEGREAGVYKQGVDTDEGYIKRMMSGDYFNDVDLVDKPLAARNAKLKTNRDLLKFMQENPTADLEFDPLVADAKRAANQGRLTQKAKLAREVTKNPALNLSDDGANAAMEKAIAAIAASGQKDYAYKLTNAWKGIPPRGQGWLAQGLHKGNKLFKSAATFGVILPRLAFNFGNRLSGSLGQIISNPEARKTILASAGRFGSDLAGAHKDGLLALRESLRAFDADYVKAASGGNSTRATAMSRALENIETAFQTSGGSAKKVRETLSKMEDGERLVAALDNGVLDNFVSSEELLTRMAGNDTWSKIKDVMMWPAHIAQGVEQRMRVGTFLDLLDDKLEPGAAARTVKGTYLDYDVPGLANRRFRDVVPFGAFLSQNVKQQAKFIAEQPAIAVATSQLYGEDEGMPKYPWLEQQASMPAGLDEQGNPQFISSFRQSIEGMTSIPGFDSNDIWRDTVGNLQPLLKTGIAYAANKDPFTGREFGGYDKIMGESMGGLGRAYNVLMGTGLTQAIGTPINQIASLTDERKSNAEKALQFVTGVRFVSVDPDLAERQKIEDYLKKNPDAKQYSDFYQEGEDEDLSALLQQLNDAKKRLKVKRDAAAVL